MSNSLETIAAKYLTAKKLSGGTRKGYKSTVTKWTAWGQWTFELFWHGPGSKTLSQSFLVSHPKATASLGRLTTTGIDPDRESELTKLGNAGNCGPKCSSEFFDDKDLC